MFTFLGVIAILLAITFFLIPLFVVTQDQYRQAQGRSGQPIQKLVRKKSPEFLLLVKRKWAYWALTVGIVLILIPGAFFYAEPGQAYAVQFPWGTDKAIMTQGIKFKGWGRLIHVAHQMSIKDVLADADTKDESEYTYLQKATKREFNDAVTGDVANTLVVGIDLDQPDKFKKVATDNRSERNLVFSRIIPFRDAVLKNTAKLMSAQDYIAGASAEFDRAYEDQMKNGLYELEEVPYSEMSDTIGNVGTTRTIDDNSNRKKYKIKYIKDSTGVLVPSRTTGSLTDLYGLKILLAVVNKIDWETKFDDRLDKQKEQVAATQLEKQMAEKAVFNKKRLYEEGEANKAQEQAKLEKEQIQKTIEAETAAKVAKFNLEESKTLYEKAKIDANAKKIAADAQSYENKKLVEAKLTPQQEMEWNFKITDVATKNLSNTDFPDVMIINGGQGANGTSGMPILYDLLGADYANQMRPFVNKSQTTKGK